MALALRMIAPGGVSGGPIVALGGSTPSGTNYRPDAIGSILVTDPRDIIPLIQLGFQPAGSDAAQMAAEGLTANPGGGQANATPLGINISRVTTVTTAGDSVLLPPAQPGLDLIVINKGANPMAVFGTGNDQIDDQGAAVSVTQMQGSAVLFMCTVAGKWYSEGLATGFGGPGLQTVSQQDSITALGTTQGTATVLPPRMMYNVTTVAAGTGVLLPASAAGLILAVNNNQGTNPLLVYPNGADKINALAASAGFSLAVNTVGIFYCFTAGQWFTK